MLIITESPQLLKIYIFVEHSAFIMLDKAQAKSKPKAAMPTEALQLLNYKKQPKKRYSQSTLSKNRDKEVG